MSAAVPDTRFYDVCQHQQEKKREEIYLGSVLDQVVISVDGRVEDRHRRDLGVLVQGQDFGVGASMVLLQKLPPRGDGEAGRGSVGPAHVRAAGLRDPDDVLDRFAGGRQGVEVQGAGLGDEVVGRRVGQKGVELVGGEAVRKEDCREAIK
jgi:hypothetical protein